MRRVLSTVHSSPMNAQHGKASRWLGIALLVLGAGIIAGGIPIGGPVEAIAIEIGAAAAVGGIVILFEPLIRRRLNRTIREAVRAGTAELEERVVKLESVGEVQASELERQQADAEGVMASLDDPVTFSNMAELLDVAYTEGLFTERVFLKTSTKRGQPLLEITTVNAQRIGFSIHAPADSSFRGTQFKLMAEGTTIWDEGEGPDIIIGRIVSAYKILRLPHEELSLEVAFAQLKHSYEIMYATRQEPADSIKRLAGRLMFLVNDDWVLTDVGLESTASEAVFAPSKTVLGTADGIHIANTPCPIGCDPALWEEAQHYMQRMHRITSDPWPIS